MRNGGNELRYTYDASGNILTITENGVLKNSYTYDALNQLTEEVDHATGVHQSYTYDNGGNLLGRASYTLNSETGAKENQTGTGYSYTDPNWKDKLTNYNGQAITYDAIGNPLTYRDGMSFTWQNGRQLKTASANGKNLSYAYNDQGIRTQKTVDGVTTEYYLNGSAIYTQVTGSTRLDFLYDDAGDLLGFLYNGRGYYYVRNVQNDITGILNSDGTQIVSYTYDAWGAPTSTTGTEADTIGSLNPFRYRGYYYDAESSLYYLNSRYYDPQVGRFLNADAILGANKDLISYNVFAYCSNNPVNCYDESGRGKIWNSIKNAVTKVKNWITGTSAPPVVYSPSGQKIGGGNYISGNASSYIYTSKKQSQKLPTHGKPNSTAKTPDGKTEREYGPDGRAKKDTHYGHPEHHPELESPHYHDWDWIGNIGKPGAAYNFNNALLIGVGLVVGASVALIWIVGNDITGVGITDDAAILPLLGMFGQGAKMLAGG